MNIDFDAVMKATNNMTFPTLCKGKALKVWSIYKTNGFPNGVFLKMSRFNHSCRPNAEWLWNKETKTQDVRVLRKIKEGEEITLGYTSQWAREERRAELENYFNFNCRCEACDISEEEILEEKEITEKFKDEEMTRNCLLTSGLKYQKLFSMMVTHAQENGRKEEQIL